MSARCRRRLAVSFGRRNDARRLFIRKTIKEVYFGMIDLFPKCQYTGDKRGSLYYQLSASGLLISLEFTAHLPCLMGLI